MFAVSPIATNPTALSVQPTVLAAPASDLVSTRLTPVALSAPLTNTQVNNDARNPVAVPAPAANVQQVPPQVASAAPLTASANASGPSTPFLAQLISQNDNEGVDNQIALATSFSRFAPAPQYTTFIAYSVVKYRPSDAGMPSAYAPPASPSRNDSLPEVTVPSDYQAYSTTQTRNQSNLPASEPTLVVAG